MKKFLLLFVMMLLPKMASAGVLIDGVWYSVNGDNAAVSFNGRVWDWGDSDSYIVNNAHYEGDVIIHSSVEIDGKEYPVTSIESLAFYGCYGITSISIPSSITSIGQGAFGFSGLKSIYISDLAAWCKIKFENPFYSDYERWNTINPSYQLFLNGIEVKDLVIPDEIATINKYTFYGCSGLSSVTIHKDVASIDYFAFSNCDGLTAVHVSDINSWNKISFSSADANPLSSAHHLYINGAEVKELVIPSSITYVNDYAFYGCSGLSYLIIPNSVTSIGSSAFLGCSGLTSVTIPNSVTSIGSSAFLDCSGLTSVTIPNSLKSIEGSVFSGCSGLTSVTIPNSVTSIGSSAFLGCSGLTSVTIPNSLESIESSVFSGCSGLTSVTIPNSVTSIGSSAFLGCSGLTSVTIPNSLESIEGSVFSGCSGLTSVTIPNSVTSIGSSAFEGCSSLTNLILPKSMLEIGWKAFAGCENIQTVTSYAEKPPIHSSYSYYIIYEEDEQMAELMSYFFPDMSNAVLYVPNGRITAYEKEFEWGTFKTILEIGTFSIDGINYKIASEEQKTAMVISAESSLSNVVIPSQVTYNGETYTVNSIAQSAFEENTTITGVEIPNSVTYVSDRAFFGCTNLKTVKLPDGLNKLCFHVFSRCSSLTDITLPENLTSIDEGALYRCSSLTSVTIPSGVTEIGTHAFYYCEKLAEVKSKMVTPPAVKDQTFEGIASGAILRVPAGRMSTYQGTSGWDKFAKIEESLDGNNKCAKPTISFADGKLSFNCSTEGVDYQYTITDDDVKTGKGNDITLGMTYHVTVYATKDGLEKSDVATMDIVISGSGTPTVRGDLNGDGQVNVADHVELTKIIMAQ